MIWWTEVSRQAFPDSIKIGTYFRAIGYKIRARVSLPLHDRVGVGAKTVQTDATPTCECRGKNAGSSKLPHYRTAVGSKKSTEATKWPTKPPPRGRGFGGGVTWIASSVLLLAAVGSKRLPEGEARQKGDGEAVRGNPFPTPGGAGGWNQLLLRVSATAVRKTPAWTARYRPRQCRCLFRRRGCC